MAEEKARKPMNPALKQWLVPIAVLVCICLVCVLLLALCNDLLYVSPEEKFNRTIRKVWDGYGAGVQFTEKTVDSKFSSNPNYGEVLEVRSASDGSYVITSKGTVGAFGGGSVTILIAIGPNPEAKILGWALQGNEGQTFIANITEKHQKEWFVGSTVSDVQATVTPNAGQGKGSGATYTENALANAVNMACYYCQNALKLGANPEGDAKDAVLALLTEKGIEGYTSDNLSAFGSKSALGTELDGASDQLKYVFVSSSEDSLTIAYTYGEGDGIKIVVVKDGKLIAQSANVTGDEDFVTNILAKPLQEIAVTATVKLYAFITGIQSNVYTVIGIKLGSYTPNDYTLTVTISADGKVEAITIVEDGYVAGAPSKDDANKLANTLVGASLDDIDSKYASDKVSGATQSADIIMAAVKAALTHFDANNASSN